MKRQLALAILTASFYIAFPASAQTAASREGHDDGHGHGHGHGHHGNNSNHSGHDDDGHSAGHRKDGPQGFGDDFGDDDNLVLANPGNKASVASAVTSVATDLKSSSLKSTEGGAIPAAAQNKAYLLRAGDVNLPASKSAMIAALSTAGPDANAIAPSLVESFAALRTDPARLPAVVAAYNKFTKAASSSFIASPPPEFLAIHAALARFVEAAGATK